MDSVAGEQLPLTSFFSRSSAPGNRKQQKKKEIPSSRKKDKQSKLALAPTPASTASNSTKRKTTNVAASQTAKAPKRSQPNTTRSSNSTVHLCSKPSAAGRKRPLPTTIKPMTPALSSPSVRKNTSKATEDDSRSSSPLSSLSPSPSPSSLNASPAKKRRVYHDSRTPTTSAPRQLPTPSTSARVVPQDRLRHALRFETPPRDLFNQSQDPSEPASPSPVRKRLSSSSRPKVLRSPARPASSVQRIEDVGEDLIPTSPVLSPYDENAFASALNQRQSTLAASQGAVIPTSQSAEKLLACDALTLSPKRSRFPPKSPVKAVPSSQEFESPIKKRPPLRSPMKAQSIVPTSQYFEESMHIIRSPMRSKRVFGESASQPESPIADADVFGDVPSTQSQAENDLFFEKNEPIPSSQTQLLSPVRKDNLNGVHAGSPSPVKSSQAYIEDDLPKPLSYQVEISYSPFTLTTPQRQRYNDPSQYDDLGSTPIRGLSLLRSSSPLLEISSSSSCPTPQKLIKSTVLHPTPRALEEFAALLDDEGGDIPVVPIRTPVVTGGQAGSDTEDDEDEPVHGTESEARFAGAPEPVGASPMRSHGYGTPLGTQAESFSLPSDGPCLSFPFDLSLSSSHPSLSFGSEAGIGTLEVVKDFCSILEDD